MNCKTCKSACRKKWFHYNSVLSFIVYSTRIHTPHISTFRIPQPAALVMVKFHAGLDWRWLIEPWTSELSGLFLPYCFLRNIRPILWPFPSLFLSFLLSCRYRKLLGCSFASWLRVKNKFEKGLLTTFFFWSSSKCKEKGILKDGNL